MFHTLLLTLAMAGSMAAAQPREITYEETVLPFAEWQAKFPAEKNAMGLTKNYEEPWVDFMENGIRQSKQMKLVIYAVRLRTAVNKPVSQIDLAKLVTIGAIRQLDPESQYEEIAPEQTMAVTAGSGKVDNFSWCNKNPQEPLINLQKYELPLTHLKGKKWCEKDGRTLCVESCFLFTGGWYGGVSTLNGILRASGSRPEKLKDYGIATNAEVRYFKSDADYGQDLKALTGIKAPVRGVVELNIFYFNQGLQYGKLLAVMQEHPQYPQATLISAYVAMGMREKTWSKKMYGPMRSALKGERDSSDKPVFHGCPVGITAGIPQYSRCMVLSLAGLIEKQ